MPARTSTRCRAGGGGRSSSAARVCTSAPCWTGSRSRRPIPRLSRHQYNLIGYYERGGLSARVAYNWRSRFNFTSEGGNSTQAIGLYEFFRPQGFLDATVRYAVTSNFEFSLQAQNLLDTETEVVQQLTDAGTEEPVIFAPNTFGRSDRRFILGARVRF